MVVLLPVWPRCTRTWQMLLSGKYHHVWITHWKFESFSIWDCSLKYSTSVENHDTISTMNDDIRSLCTIHQDVYEALRTNYIEMWHWYISWCHTHCLIYAAVCVHDGKIHTSFPSACVRNHSICYPGSFTLRHFIWLWNLSTGALKNVLSGLKKVASLACTLLFTNNRLPQGNVVHFINDKMYSRVAVQVKLLHST